MTHRDTHEDREGRVRWKRDGVQEHGANSDNSNKSDVLRPHTVSSSVCASHPNPSHAPLKTWNLCRQLNLLTLWPLYPFPPPGVEHHWKEEVTPPRRGKVDSDDAFQMRGSKMDGGGCSWKQHVFTSQRIPNSLFSPCMTNLSHSVQLLPEAGGNYRPERLSSVWLLLSPPKPQKRLFMFCFSVF